MKTFCKFAKTDACMDKYHYWDERLKTAGKVFDLLVKSDICMSYTECLLTLRIVTNAIREVTGGERE